MDLLADLDARGLIHDTTDRAALEARLARGPVTLYHGVDPTADSLHTGNLIGLLVLRRFLAAGHRPLALAGGATGMIGDPSGRSEERNLLDEAALGHNIAAIKDQISRVLGGDAELVDNHDWTGEVRLLDFLRDVGKHVTVNQMVARESVKQRMAGERGISFTEFSYMLLQANDFLWLHENRECELQVGGSDQWGNILSGVDLIRRRGGGTAHGLCWPLLTAPDGTKLGKTTGARIWLDPAQTSPYRFYQHWIHTDDRQVEQFLLWFTLLSVDEARGVAAAHAAEPGRRSGQRVLAREVTAVVHGPAAAAAAEAASAVLFGGSVDEVDEATFGFLAEELPVGPLVLGAPGPDEVPVLDALVSVGLAPSRSRGLKLLEQGGVRVNGQKVGSEATLSRADLRYGAYVLLRAGRQYALLRA